MSDQTREKIREMVRQALFDSLAEPSVPEVVAPSGDPKPSPREYYSPWTGNAYEAHHSQRRFAESGDSGELTAAAECLLERGRNCDDCGKCRAFGF